jgi:hypothetical protein
VNGFAFFISSKLGRRRSFANDALRSVLLDDIGLVQHVELGSGVFTSVQHDGSLSAWMIDQKVGHIKNLHTKD